MSVRKGGVSKIKVQSMPAQLDIVGNRKARKYTNREMVLRVLWSVGLLVFRCSLRPAFRWRNTILRTFGATVGKNVHIYSSAVIYYPWNLVVGDLSSIGEESLVYSLGKVTLGQRVTISHRAHLCAGTHDYNRSDLPLMTPPINVGDEAWICADAFIGPGVRIGQGAVVGARAVAVQDVAPWSVVAGNPARHIKTRRVSTPSAEQPPEGN